MKWLRAYGERLRGRGDRRTGSKGQRETKDEGLRTKGRRDILLIGEDAEDFFE
jgi:hypothetical protein